MTTSESLFWAREGGYVKRLLATASPKKLRYAKRAPEGGCPT